MRTLRQVALVAHELEPVVADLCAILGIEIALRDPGVAEFGLHNAVMPIGTRFLEVVSPQKEGTSAGRYLARRRGDGGYMAIFQTPDIQSDRDHFEAKGVRTVWEISLDDITSSHLHPRDTGGAIVSIDQPKPPASWRWAGRDWESKIGRDLATDLAGVEVQCDDPGALAHRWSDLIGGRAPVVSSDDGAATFALEGTSVRFVRSEDERGEGIRAVDVRAKAPLRSIAIARERECTVQEDRGFGPEVEIGGVWFRFGS